MNKFTLVDTHNNSNEIDGTLGCPHVQVMGLIYRCSLEYSEIIAATAFNHGGACTDPGYLQVNDDNHPRIAAAFHKEHPNADYEFLVFKRGLKTNHWYVSTICF